MIQQLLRAPLLSVCFILLSTALHGQVVTFFDESSDETYYDTGLAFLNEPSTFVRTGPSGDKIPVNNSNAYRGNHSLSFSWNSKAGGNWDALVIAPGFPFLDLSNSDSISFWVFSDSGINAQDLPTISMEGAPGNTKSNKYPLEDFTGDIPAGSWHHITIGLDVFTNDPVQTNIQFNQIKAIIFSQNADDGVQHSLLVDEVKAVPASTGVPPTPTGFMGKGYELHGSFEWEPITSQSFDGYHLYSSSDAGQSYQLSKYIPSGDSMAVDFWGTQGTGNQYLYRMTAVGFAGEESSPTPSVPISSAAMNDDEFMDMVQEATFRYFWDFAHPVSGLARERNTSLNTVTSGGSGFGIMAIIVGIERGYITRQEGLDRLLKITAFLDTADRFHGAWAHWMNGTTGKVIPFSENDNGGDLVETAFLVQGLLCARSYFDQPTTADSLLRANITDLWESVEWNWYRKLNQPVLYWHWSPDKGWIMNFPLRGFNEVHITYILGIASPTNSIPSSLYDTGWAGGGGYTSNQTHYGYKLFTGPTKGGPLFFSHYSYLGFDPRNITDGYANYFLRNAHHTLVNRAWCIDNPENHLGYSDVCWGLTASDDPLVGYLAHEPTLSRDNGTISPTAALSSMPYTPSESMAALKHFYRELGEDLWGPMGFYDAFNLNENWFADSYLAIDQGPIVVMLENYRTGLFWDLFMENPEIQPALDAIGFTPDSTWVTSVHESFSEEWTLGPNPMSQEAIINISGPGKYHNLSVSLFDSQGRNVLQQAVTSSNTGNWEFSIPRIAAGTYYVNISADGQNRYSQIIKILP